MQVMRIAHSIDDVSSSAGLSNNQVDGVPNHNMGCSIDAIGPQAVKSTNDFVTAQDVGTAMAPVVKTTSSDGKFPSIVQEPNMG